MKKRNLMLGSAMLLVVLLVAGGTFAWFTATAEPVVNEFKAGTLKIELIDEFEGAPNVNPGDCYDKDVYVKNLGTKTAFVRIKKDLVLNSDPNGAADIALNINVVEYTLGEDWVEHDGYFYYTKKLEVGGLTPDKTSLLFADDANGNNICFNGPNMNNDYQGATLDIKIAPEAIQTTNGAALEVWGIDPLTL